MNPTRICILLLKEGKESLVKIVKETNPVINITLKILYLLLFSLFYSI